MSTGAERSQNPTRFSPVEPDLGYRPISPLAVVSLVFGFAALLAFIRPELWFLAIVGLLVAARGSYKLERVRQEYAGQLAAKTGLLLSLFATIAAPTRYFTQRFIVCREAKLAANEFVDLILANEIKRAFFLTATPWQRLQDVETQTNEADDELIGQTIARSGERYRMFLYDPMRDRLGGRGADAQVTHLGVVEYGYAREEFRVVIHYSISLDGRNLGLMIGLRGAASHGGEWKGRQWYVERWELKDHGPTA
jgi:hypothetical protein